MCDTLGVGSLQIGNLVEEPNQYLQYSGEISIMAMAHMLKRRIVTLMADTILVYPQNPESFCVEPAESPVVIYHCAAGNIDRTVPFNARNHYAGVFFASDSDKLIFAERIRRRCRRNTWFGLMRPTEPRRVLCSAGRKRPPNRPKR